MQQFLKHIQAELSERYSDEEIRNFGFLIAEKVTGWNRTQIIVNKNTIFSSEQRNIADSFIEKLKNSEPIQYITGETWFYGLKFKVDKNVLIPRPETEELVDWIRNDVSNAETLSILDIGTGSGCIAIGLKSVLPMADVYARDISAEALKIAAENAVLNNQKVVFQQFDILSAADECQSWDVIVSNPPYIPEAEKLKINSNVLDFEPHLALFVSDRNPLIFYEKIAGFGLKHLKPGGKLFFETHQNFAQACVRLLADKGFADIELRQDMYRNDRMIKAVLK